MDVTCGSLVRSRDTATVDGDLLGLATDGALEDCHLEIRDDGGCMTIPQRQRRVPMVLRSREHM